MYLLQTESISVALPVPRNLLLLTGNGEAMLALLNWSRQRPSFTQRSV